MRSRSQTGGRRAPSRTLASPNLPLKSEVYDLFDAITGTFRFLSEEGEPLVPVAGAS
jgi:hypothetical protein